MIDELVERRKDVEALMLEDEAGAAASNRRTAAFIKDNLDGVAAGPPEIMEGTAVIDLK